MLYVDYIFFQLYKIKLFQSRISLLSLELYALENISFYMKLEKPFEMVRLVLSGDSTHPKSHRGKFPIWNAGKNDKD